MDSQQWILPKVGKSDRWGVELSRQKVGRIVKTGNWLARPVKRVVFAKQSKSASERRRQKVNFSKALNQVTSGNWVQRNGWNNVVALDQNDPTNLLSLTVENPPVTWVATNPDLLADDWDIGTPNPVPVPDPVVADETPVAPTSKKAK